MAAKIPSKKISNEDLHEFIDKSKPPMPCTALEFGKMVARELLAARERDETQTQMIFEAVIDDMRQELEAARAVLETSKAVVAYDDKWGDGNSTWSLKKPEVVEAHLEATRAYHVKYPKEGNKN